MLVKMNALASLIAQRSLECLVLNQWLWLWLLSRYNLYSVSKVKQYCVIFDFIELLFLIDWLLYNFNILFYQLKSNSNPHFHCLMRLKLIMVLKGVDYVCNLLLLIEYLFYLSAFDTCQTFECSFILTL